VIVALSVVASWFLRYALYSAHTLALKIIKSANIGGAQGAFGKGKEQNKVLHGARMGRQTTLAFQATTLNKMRDAANRTPPSEIKCDMPRVIAHHLIKCDMHRMVGRFPL
jgi:hypothetical protein